MTPSLTIGMATYNDINGVYFTLQSLRMHHPLDNVEILVVDNKGDADTENFVTKWVPGARYMKALEATGTAAPRDLVMRQASSPYVLCLDCHVLLDSGALQSLLDYYQQYPHTSDLIQGPMIYDDLKNLTTHMDPVWRAQMFGTWGLDQQVHSGYPFEIPMHGLGLFSCRKEAWLGFNSKFRGFGGEEGYIHEKFRLAGHRTLCLPQLRWLHRFVRPGGVPYPLLMQHKVKNYFIGRHELNLSVNDIYDHFLPHVPGGREQLQIWEEECR